MEKEHVKRVAIQYFPSEYELLPDGTFEKILDGQDPKIVRVAGTNQIDISAGIAIFKALLDLVKFVYSVYKDEKERKSNKQKIIEKIQSKYPQIIVGFSEDDLNSFVDDIISK